MPFVHKRFIKICPAAVKISREGNRKQTNLPKFIAKRVDNMLKFLRRDEIARKNRYRQHGRLVGFRTLKRKVSGNAPGSVAGRRQGRV